MLDQPPPAKQMDSHFVSKVTRLSCKGRSSSVAKDCWRRRALCHIALRPGPFKFLDTMLAISTMSRPFPTNWLKSCFRIVVFGAQTSTRIVRLDTLAVI